MLVGFGAGVKACSPVEVVLGGAAFAATAVQTASSNCGLDRMAVATGLNVVNLAFDAPGLAREVYEIPLYAATNEVLRC